MTRLDQMKARLAKHPRAFGKLRAPITRDEVRLAIAVIEAARELLDSPDLNSTEGDTDFSGLESALAPLLEEK